MKELDIVRYTKTQRQLSVLLNSLMDENERFLTKFHRGNVIMKTNSDDKVLDALPLMISKNRKKVESYSESLKKFFDEYTSEILTKKDFRLLHNVVDATPISEKELEKMEVAPDGVDNKHINHQESNHLMIKGRLNKCQKGRFQIFYVI